MADRWNFLAGNYPIKEPPRLVPRFTNPFSKSAIDSTKAAIKPLRSSRPDVASQLEAVLSSGGDDSSLGLQYTRKFVPGKIGFSGSLSTSDGGAVPVQVEM